MVNSVDPDKMPHSVVSDLGLHCLQRPICPNTWVLQYTNEIMGKWYTPLEKWYILEEKYLFFLYRGVISRSLVNTKVKRKSQKLSPLQNLW